MMPTLPGIGAPVHRYEGCALGNHARIAEHAQHGIDDLLAFLREVFIAVRSFSVGLPRQVQVSLGRSKTTLLRFISASGTASLTSLGKITRTLVRLRMLTARQRCLAV